jgi:hypothetical protein
MWITLIAIMLTSPMYGAAGAKADSVTFLIQTPSRPVVIRANLTDTMDTVRKQVAEKLSSDKEGAQSVQAQQITLYRQLSKTPFNYSESVGQHIKELTGDPSIQAGIESNEKVAIRIRDDSNHQYEITTSISSTIAQVKQTLAKMMGGNVTPEELLLLLGDRAIDQSGIIRQYLHLLSREGKENYFLVIHRPGPRATVHANGHHAVKGEILNRAALDTIQEKVAREIHAPVRSVTITITYPR